MEQLDIQQTMAKKRFSKTQIYRVLRESESGTTISELIDKYGVCQTTIYNWRVKYREINRLEMDRLDALEKEYDRLKRMYAEFSREILKIKGKFEEMKI